LSPDKYARRPKRRESINLINSSIVAKLQNQKSENTKKMSRFCSLLNSVESQDEEVKTVEFVPSEESKNDRLITNEALFKTALAETKINTFMKTLDPEQLAIMLNDKDDIYHTLKSQGHTASINPEVVKQMEMQRQDEIIHYQKLHLTTARFSSEEDPDVFSIHETSDIGAELETEMHESSVKHRDRRKSNQKIRTTNFFRARYQQEFNTIVGEVMSQSALPSPTDSVGPTPDISPDKPRKQ
jgi:hypothetical protein